MNMTELYFAIEVWTEIIMASLFAVGLLLYVIIMLSDRLKQKKRKIKGDSHERKPEKFLE